MSHGTERRFSQSSRGREGCYERAVDGRNLRGPCAPKHQLGDEDTVRVASRPPREMPTVGAVPADDAGPERGDVLTRKAHVGGGRRSGRAWWAQGPNQASCGPKMRHSERELNTQGPKGRLVVTLGVAGPRRGPPPPVADCVGAPGRLIGLDAPLGSVRRRSNDDCRRRY